MTMTKKEHKNFLKRAAKEVMKKEDYQDDGLFSVFAEKIRSSYNRIIEKPVFISTPIIEFDEKIEDPKSEYGYVFHDFKIQDWNTCKANDLDRLTSSTIRDLIEYLKVKNVSGTVSFEGAIQIGEQKFNTDLMEVVKNDNLCFYISYSEMEKDIINSETEQVIKMGKNYLFTIWCIFKK